MRQANRRKYHFIYKTTCMITGKYYLGMHSTDDLNDGYMGSGKRLWYSINKYGKENHVCEILEHYFTREWLREREAELVCAETLTDPLCMNLKVGGEGGFDHINDNPEKYKDIWVNNGREWAKRTWAIINADQEKLYAHSDRSRKQVQKIRESGIIPGFKSLETQRKAVKSAHSISAKAKRTKTFLEQQHAQGKNNSQYGTCWIASETQVKKIKKTELQTYLDLGWKLGRSFIS